MMGTKAIVPCASCLDKVLQWSKTAASQLVSPALRHRPGCVVSAAGATGAVVIALHRHHPRTATVTTTSKAITGWRALHHHHSHPQQLAVHGASSPFPHSPAAASHAHTSSHHNDTFSGVKGRPGITSHHSIGLASIVPFQRLRLLPDNAAKPTMDQDSSQLPLLF
jgi:hypothetical protein